MTADISTILPELSIRKTRGKKLTKKEADKLKEEGIKIYECEKCAYYSSSDKFYKQHSKSKKHNNIDTTYGPNMGRPRLIDDSTRTYCEQCDHFYYDSGTFNRHIKTQHA